MLGIRITVAISAAICLTLLGSAATAQADVIPSQTPAGAGSTPASIVKTYSDVNNRNVPVRVGQYNFLTEQGFGTFKIGYKHNLYNLTSIGFPIHNPAGYYIPPKHPKWKVYVGYATAYKKIAGSYRPVAQIEVEAWTLGAALNYQGVAISDGKIIGISTEYCYKHEVCPNWVDVALSQGGAYVQGATSSDSTSTADQYAGSYTATPVWLGSGAPTLDASVGDTFDDGPTDTTSDN